MTQSTEHSNGREASSKRLSDAMDTHLNKLLLPMSRKISWAIGATYYEEVGQRLPRKMVDNTADTIAIEFVAQLRKYLTLTDRLDG